MKKSLLALAVLGFAGAASAQSSVTIYGVIDTSFTSIDNGVDRTNGLGSGNNSASLIGFKGIEDLGNGLKAEFLLENGINTDDGTGGAGFNRLSYIGLNGSFGKVRLGKQETQLKEALGPVDTFGTGGIAASTNYLLGGNVAGDNANGVNTLTQRVGNMATWQSANYGGFSGSVGYIFGEANDDNSANSGWGARLSYGNGPLNVQFAYQKLNYSTEATDAGFVFNPATGVADPVTAAAATDADDKITILGATYDFGAFKLHGIYGDRKLDDGLADNDSVKIRSGLVGVTVPFGASAIRAEYIKNDVRDIDEADSDVWALSYTYAMSKRTTLYATYARVSNDDNSDLGIGNKAAAQAGENTSGVAIGINHKF